MSFVLRRTVRLRLTLLYGGLFLVSGALLLAVTYVLVAHTFPELSLHNVTTPGSGPLEPLPALPGQALLSAGATHQRSVALRHLLVISCCVMAVMSVAAVGLGWVVAGRVLRPVRTITTAVRDISSTNLHRRLDLPGPRDELTELGDTFDDLLGRLEQSFASQRQFVANASHELRTPLALERALLEAALTDPEATAVSLRATAERVLASNEHQGRLIEALLTLASSERGLDRWASFDLSDVVEEALLCPRPEIGRRGLRLRVVREPAPVRGDRGLIERLVANLVDNAVRHNLEAGTVDVTVGTTAGRAVLSLSNTGPVVAAADVGRLLQPFQRHSAARTGQDGFGLGLSIVAAIACAHGATLVARPEPDGGLQVEVTFPPPPQS